MKKLYLVGLEFEINKGSYAGFFEEFAKYSSKQGCEVTILTGRANDNQKENEEFNGIKIIRFDVPKLKIPGLGMNLKYLFLSKKIKKFFKKNVPKTGDLILANSRAALGLKGLKYVYRMGQPAFIFLKSMEIAKDEVSLKTRIGRLVHFTLQSFMEKKCIRNATAYIVSSEESRNYNDEYYGVKDKPFFSPHSGVKYWDFQDAKKIKLKGKNLLFVSAGSEKVRKGIVYLEKALPELFEKYSDLNLLHVGQKFDWNVPEKYKDRINSVGKVSWSEMKNYFISADMIALCSLHEIIPNTVFEAMAAGCPVVSSDMVGMNEVINHKKTGYIYKRGDVKGLIDGVSYMLDNEKKRNEMAKFAKKKIKEISYELYSKRLLTFMENAISNSRVESFDSFERFNNQFK